MRLALVLLVAGCGRLSFEPLGGSVTGDRDAALADSGGTATDAPIDAAIDAPPGSVTAVFGECAGATVTEITADTFLDPGRPDENFGRRDEMRIGNDPGKVSMVRFGLASLPTTAQVVSAKLSVWTSASDALEQGSVEVYAVLEGWVEGSGDYSLGLANWNERQPQLGWTNPGAGPPVSRGIQAIGSFVPSAENTRYETPLQATVVQGWIADPSSNFGMALVGTGTADQGGWLSTREAADPARRPCLEVTYLP